MRPGAKITIRLSLTDRRRVDAMAKRSEVSVEHWLRSAVMHAAACDEGHWREMDERASLAMQVDRDFGRLSRVHLSGLPSCVVDLLVEQLVLARQKGRQEGAESARKLAVARRGGGA